MPRPGARAALGGGDRARVAAGTSGGRPGACATGGAPRGGGLLDTGPHRVHGRGRTHRGRARARRPGRAIGVPRHPLAAPDPGARAGHLGGPGPLSARRRGRPRQDHRGRAHPARAEDAGAGAARAGGGAGRALPAVGGGDAPALRRGLPARPAQGPGDAAAHLRRRGSRVGSAQWPVRPTRDPSPETRDHRRPTPGRCSIRSWCLWTRSNRWTGGGVDRRSRSPATTASGSRTWSRPAGTSSSWTRRTASRGARRTWRAIAWARRSRRLPRTCSCFRPRPTKARRTPSAGS